MSIADRLVRRLVTIDDAAGASRVLSDALLDDVLRDPARPGYSSTRVWATDRTPALALAAEQVRAMARSLAAPPGGAVFSIVVLPPDAAWLARVTRAAVEAYFHAAGSPAACCWAPDAPHPYMQRTLTLDLCVVLEGTPTLVLDDARVALQPTDTIVQRATRHAWSNPGAQRCVIAISSHDAAQPQSRQGVARADR